MIWARPVASRVTLRAFFHLPPLLALRKSRTGPDTGSPLPVTQRTRISTESPSLTLLGPPRVSVLARRLSGTVTGPDVACSGPTAGYDARKTLLCALRPITAGTEARPFESVVSTDTSCQDPPLRRWMSTSAPETG